MMAWIRCMLCLATLAGAGAPAPAQPGQAEADKRAYVPFEIDKNAADIVKQRLQLERDLGPFKNVINQILQNPKKMDAEWLKKLAEVKDQDAKVQNAVKDMLRNDPKLTKDLEEWVNKTKAGNPRDDLKKSLNKLGEFLKEPSNPPVKTDVGKPPQLPEPKQDAKADEPIRKSFENLMKRAENTDLGDWLANSPAWQQAYRDLRMSMDGPQAAKWKLGDWPGNLLAPDSKGWKLGEDLVARIKDMPRPGLGEWSEKVKLPGLGNLPMPNLGPPALSVFEAPTLPSLGAGAPWLLLVILCVFVGWRMMRWSKGPVAVVDWRASLGPWPVKPDAVATRSDLVQAFDYLAILTLGQDAKSWNHQAISRRWSANAPAQAHLAHALAGLYEQSRYTDGAAELTHAQRDQARQSLLQLAEAR